jgi:hypothetical protein
MIRIRRQHTMILGLVLVAGLGAARTASCYLLPAQQILEFVAKQTSRLYNFRLEATVENQDPAAPGGVVNTQMVYYAARPDSLRLETPGATNTNPVLISSGVRLSVIAGHLLKEAARHEEIFPILLFADSAGTLQSLLAAEHVDLTQVHLARMENQIAYVIGGPPGDPAAPQFWCDKERFWPLRLVGLRSREGVTDLVDIRFLSYREVGSDIWMPSAIEFYRRNQLVQRLVIQRVYPNQRFREHLFDLKAFAAQYPPLPSPPAAAEKAPQGFDEMQRYLKKKYE